MRLTPEEIEARRFRLAPNGYDCEAVDRFLAEITEALREQPVSTAGSDEFSRVGQEIAAARSRAELEATDLRKEAKSHLIEAEKTLAEAREQAELIIREAEHHAEEIRHAERVARQRLLATRTDLQNMIDRLGGPTGKSVLDLTGETGETESTDEAGEGRDLLATGGPSTEVGEPAEAPAELGDPLLRMVRAAVGRAAEHSEAEAARDQAVELETQVPAV